MTLPSADDDYTASNGLPLNKATWDAVFNSIGERLRAMEALRISYEEAIAQMNGLALEAIQNTLGPEVEAIQSQLQTLAADITLAEGLLANLMNSPSLPAALITFAPTGSISSTNVQAAIVEVAAEAASLDDIIVFG